MTVGASESATLKQSASPSAFVFAREFGERASEINDFYNAFTGRSRSLAAYHWEFQAGPGGPALIWTIVDSSSQRVVGHHSIIPTPLVLRGTTIAGGRTENTIIDPAVRHRVFYPGMEKKALAATLRVLRVIYTIHSTGPAKLRLRLGYRPVGRWIVYLPKVGSAYFHALLKRGCSALSLKVPAAMLAVLAAVTGRLHSAVAWLGRQPRDFEAAEISDITVVAQEYERFWNRARQRYDLTIDRSLDFLRWRVVDNPHLHFRDLGPTPQGGLGGHRHRSSAPSGRRFRSVHRRYHRGRVWRRELCGGVILFARSGPVRRRNRGNDTGS